MTKELGILFDLDGTLVDTAPDFVLAANKLRELHQLPAMPASEISLQVSNGSIAVTRYCMAIEEDHPDFTALRQQLLDLYQHYLGAASALYPVLETALNELNRLKIPWGIVTNKPVVYAKPLIEQLKLHTSCSTLICPDHVSQTKPDPEPLLLAAKKIGMAPTNCFYIGDHRRDIAAGKAAGMKTIAAAYGYIDTKEDLADWQSDLIVNSSNELADYLIQQISG